MSLSKNREDAKRMTITRSLGIELEIQLNVGAVLNLILPYIVMLSANRRRDQGEQWFKTATLLVTTPADLSPDGSVSDEALQNRIRAGIVNELRIVRDLTGKENNAPVKVDHLQNAVNKSELANRFGVALLRLGHPARAVQFLELARSLAGSDEQMRANATVNLAQAQNSEGFSGIDIGDVQRALESQKANLDWKNAVITSTNMLLWAAASGRALDDSFIKEALALCEKLPHQVDKVNARCQLLGATASYYASRRRHAEALALRDEISKYLDLNEPPQQVGVSLNQLGRWYYEHGDYSRAAKIFTQNAATLAGYGLDQTEFESWLMAAEAWLRASNGRVGSSLRKFFTCAISVGVRHQKLKQNGENLERAEIHVENIRENVVGIWEQIPQVFDSRLLLEASRALRILAPSRINRSARWLEAAFQPANVARVKAVAEADRLVRRGEIWISHEAIVRVETTTQWNTSTGHELGDLGDPSREGSAVLFTQPLYDHGAARASAGDAEFIGGLAVFPLAPGRSLTVSESVPGVLYRGPAGTKVFKDVWGSERFPYSLDIHLAPGLVPLQLRFRQATSEPSATIEFNQSGAHIRLTPPRSGGTRWRSEILLIFHENSKFVDFISSNAVASIPLPFALWELLLSQNKPS